MPPSILAKPRRPGWSFEVGVIDRDDDLVDGRQRLGRAGLGVGLGGDLALGHVGELGGDLVAAPLGDLADAGS